MTLDLDDLESKAKAAGGGEWFASVIGLRVNAINAKIGGETPICDIRGWGYLTGQGHGALGLSEKEAIAVQRAIADYIASANPATMLTLVAHIRELEELIDEICEYQNTGYGPIPDRETADKLAQSILDSARAMASKVINDIMEKRR